jgi:outer membrane protein assembly factor BamB
VLLSLVLPLLAAPSGASDWPQWRGPARDGHVPGTLAWPAALQPGWTATVGVGHASPVVSKGRVYVFARQGEDEVLQAMDLATGQVAWTQKHPAPYTMNSAATGHGKGPKSTPVVGEGKVCTLGISGTLSCHDADKGTLLWRHSFQGEFPATSPLFGAAMSPVVDRGLLIAHVGGNDKGALTAFDLATGAPRWSWKGDGPGYASPVIADVAGARQVVTQTQTKLVGLSAGQGELLWSVPFTTEYSQNSVTPLVHGDLVIYSGVNQPVRAVRVAKKGAALAAEPAWENAEVSSYMSTPVLAQGKVFGLSHRKKGQVYALDAASGRTLWLSDGRQGDNASLLVAGSMLLVLSTDAELSVVPLDATSFTPARRYTVAKSAVWAHPAVVPDGLLVKDQETLARLKF